MLPHSSPFAPSDAVNGAGRRELFAVLALCLAWILPGLIGHQPWKPDEAYSFGLVYHILQTGDWVVPTLAGEPFMEKPPLYYLTAAAFAKLFSFALPLHDGARLASGFYMALTFLFVGLTGRELWGGGQGRIAVLVLVGSLGLLVHGHEMITDTALMAGFAAAWYGLALGLRRAGWGGFWLGTGTGMGFLAKGLIAPGMIGLTALLLPLLFRAWRTRAYLASLLAAAAAALPWLTVWPYALYLRSPELFGEWFWRNNFGRFLGFVNLGPTHRPGFYLETLPWFTWPAWPLVLWGLWATGRNGLAGLTRPGMQLPLAAFVVMLTVLGVASDARELYALPLLLPLSLLAIPGVQYLRRGAASALNWFGIMTFGFFSGVLWFFWFAMTTGHPERNARHLLELQPGYTPGFEPAAFTSALILTLAWLALLLRPVSAHRARRAVINWAAGITLLWGVLMTVGLSWVDAGKSYRSMILSLQGALPAHFDCMASRGLGEPQRAMLDYYAGIKTRRLEKGNSPLTCELLLVQGNVRQEEKGPGPEWQEIWQGARPGDKSERYWLFRRMS
jgi:4-amino-4-deoxy-L-arabinose transferase-like glycosyltransferase